MGTLTTNGLTLVEVAHRHDPNGQMATIAEVLAEDNEILQDATWMEANDTFSNMTVRRASEPSGTWRKLNSGVSPEKSDTIQMVDTIGMLDTISQNDVEIINAFTNPKQARNDEAMAFVKGLSKEMAATMIYGNTLATPEEFTGLAPRMDDLAESANVIGAGGSASADQTSIFVVDWGKDGVYMTYPKNSKAGLDHVDMGIQLVTAQSTHGTGQFRAFTDYFSWKAGMVVRNNKSIGRVANIESAGVANIFDEDDLITLMNRMTKGPGRRIYVNETVMTQMEIRAKDKTNINYNSVDGIAPGPVLFFKGVPVRQVDQIVNTEEALN